MTSWIDLPRYRATVSGQTFEQVVEAMTSDLGSAFGERSLGMAHVSCVGPGAHQVATALINALRAQTSSTLFGVTAPSRFADTLRQRIAGLLHDLEAVPELVTSRPGTDRTKLVCPGRETDVDSYLLGTMLASAYLRLERADDGAIKLDAPSRMGLLRAVTGALAEPQLRNLTWSDLDAPLGDVDGLVDIARALDPSWRVPLIVIANDQWASWAHPLLATVDASKASGFIDQVASADPALSFDQIHETVAVVAASSGDAVDRFNRAALNE